jgi:hypothetical protein
VANGTYKGRSLGVGGMWCCSVTCRTGQPACETLRAHLDTPSALRLIRRTCVRIRNLRMSSEIWHERFLCDSSSVVSTDKRNLIENRRSSFRGNLHHVLRLSCNFRPTFLKEESGAFEIILSVCMPSFPL